jgi:hypothetical protein
MPSKIELLQEAERRGILPANKRELYGEAVKRGLIKSSKTAEQTKPKLIKGSDVTRFKQQDQGDKLNVGVGTQPYLKSLKGSRQQTDIDEALLPERQPPEPLTPKRIVSNIARPVISGLTSATGAIIGTPEAPGPGTILGGGIGYAIGEEIADKLDEFLGLRERQPLMVEIKESAADVAEGATYEMGGQVLAKGIGGVVNFVAKRMQGIPLTKAGAKRSVGKQLIAQTDNGPLVAKNYEDARELEELIPGLKFRVGQLTDDPGVVKFERARARMTGDTAAGQAELQTQNTEALKAYITKVKGGADIGDVTGALRAEREGIETGLTEAQKALERETVGISGGPGAVETGQQIRSAARSGQAESRKEAGKLFEDVPQFEIDASRISSKIDELSQPINRFEDIEGNVPKEFARIKEALKESNGIATPDDLQGLRSSLTDSLRDAQGAASPNNKMTSRISKLIDEVDTVLKEAGEVSPQARYKGKIIRTDKLNKELSKINEKLATESHFTDETVNIDQTYKELQSAKVPGIMQQVQEGSKEYSDRIAKQYRIEFGKDAPMIQGTEKVSIAKAKTRKGEIQKILSESVEIPKTEMEASAKKLKTAQQFFKKEVIEKYKHGTIGDILKKSAKGDKVGNAQVASRFFKPGQKGLQQADEFINAIGDNPQAKQAMEDYIKQDLLEYATNPVTGEVTETKLKTWLAKYKPALKKYGLENKFDSIVKARQSLDDALVLKNKFDKSQASKLLNSDVDKALQNALSSGSKRTEVRKLIKALKGDKKAISGLQNSLIDQIIYKDVAEQTPRTMAKLNDQYLKYKPALDEAFKDTPEKIRALNVYRDVMEKLEIGKYSPIGGGSDTAENIVSGIAKRFGLSNSRIVSIVKSVAGILKGNSDKTIDTMLNRAAYDPDFAYTLMLIAKGRKPDVVKRRFYGHFISSGTTGIRQEFKKD